MRLLFTLGRGLLVGLAMSAIVTPTASAAETEAGLLYLVGESGAVTFETSGGVGTITTSAGSMTCQTGKGSGKSSQTEKHATSGTGTISLKGCKEQKGETKVSCRTGETAEEITIAGEVTLFNALDRATKKTLEPGLGLTVSPTLKVKCGAVSIVEYKGTILGLLLVSSLTADLTAAAMHFVNEGELCDTENVFCKKAQEKGNELLANFTGSFEKATLEGEESVTLGKMMLVDD